MLFTRIFEQLLSHRKAAYMVSYIQEEAGCLEWLERLAR